MEIEKNLNRVDAINFLRTLADALENNKAVTIDGQSINLPADMEIELEFESDEEGSELEVEFKWNAKKKSRVGKINLFQGKNSHWYYNLKAGNGEIILASDKGFDNKEAALACVELIKTGDVAFEDKMSKSGQPFFSVLDKDGNKLGKSQMYKRKTGAVKGQNSIKKWSKDAEVIEVAEA